MAPFQNRGIAVQISSPIAIVVMITIINNFHYLVYGMQDFSVFFASLHDCYILLIMYHKLLSGIFRFLWRKINLHKNERDYIWKLLFPDEKSFIITKETLYVCGLWKWIYYIKQSGHLQSYQMQVILSKLNNNSVYDSQKSQ